MKLSLSLIWFALLSLVGSLTSPSYQTAVILTSFTAEASTDSIAVMWETASETNNLGFYLWRSLDEAGDYTNISGFILSLDEGAGASYAYEDSAVTLGVPYYYKLQNAPGDGTLGTFTDPITATIPLTTTYIFLPAVYRGWLPTPFE